MGGTPDSRTRNSGQVAVRLDGFSAQVTREEAARLGISVEELVSFSVLYYLADVDSGRIARQIATSPLPRATR